MGIYLNPGNDAFRMALNDDIYVDKSGLIGFVNDRIGKRNRFICVSRPRRFGKSMAAEMLAAYYGRNYDSDGLFRKLAISKSDSYREHLNRHDVIVINTQKFLRKAGDPKNLGAYIEKKSAEGAIRQIKERNYPQVLQHYGGEVLLVGISYDERTKRHSCLIEKYEK